MPADVQADARDQGGNERNVYGVIDRDNHVWVVLGSGASLALVESNLTGITKVAEWTGGKIGQLII